LLVRIAVDDTAFHEDLAYVESFFAQYALIQREHKSRRGTMARATLCPSGEGDELRILGSRVAPTFDICSELIELDAE